jgi:Raf kinase inhibitor-like YbhB/YbcL family protein
MIVGSFCGCGGEDPQPANGNLAGASPLGMAGTAGAAGTVGAGGNSGAGVGAGGTAGAAVANAGMGGVPSGGQAAGGSSGAAGDGGAGGAGGMAGSGGAAAAPFVLTSPMLTHVDACTQQDHQPCMLFSKTNEMMSMNGDNLSPELDWGPGPDGTQSYAITLHDFSNNFTHWAIWNIPAATLTLPAALAKDSHLAVPPGAQQMSFDNNNAGFGYMGPGADDHVYEFRLYALKAATFSPKNPNDQSKIYDELEADAGQLVVGKSMLRGRSKKY